MAFAKKTFTPEQIETARRLYDDPQTPLQDVAASLQITRRTLDARIAEWGWPARTALERNSNRARGTSSGRTTKATRNANKRPNRKRPSPKRSGAEPEPAKPAKPNAGEHVDSASPPLRSRKALAVRVQRVVERELDAIDSILGVLGAADSAEAERSARTLASLARALKEVMRLAAPEQASDPDEDDPVPRDLDEFRRELARRIEALAAEAEGQAAGDGG